VGIDICNVFFRSEKKLEKAKNIDSVGQVGHPRYLGVSVAPSLRVSVHLSHVDRPAPRSHSQQIGQLALTYHTMAYCIVAERTRIVAQKQQRNASEVSYMSYLRITDRTCRYDHVGQSSRLYGPYCGVWTAPLSVC
jgi:hypothetical protein